MVVSANLTLFVDAFFISPYAFSSFVALSEKGLAFDIQVVPLQDKGQDRPEYRDHSLTARVPMLDHDGFGLAESSAIDEYLEDMFPPPAYPALYPSPPRERARARQIQAWLRSDLMPIREERPTTTMFYDGAERALSAAGLAATQELFRVTERLLSPGSQHLFGSWCIVDSDLGFMLQRLVQNGDAVPPRVREYAELQWARPSTRAWCERQRIPLVPYEN